MNEEPPGHHAHLAAGFAPGSRLGGYRLEEQVGAGGMAVVFRAHDERLHRLVALKIMTPAMGSDDMFRQRFIRESRAAAAVEDPHIIPVYEAGEVGHILFIAMRLVRGGDVRSLLRREGPLPADRVASIMSPVASALDAAHAAGLVHRDVKPANILLDRRPGRPDHVYLSDFGLSKSAEVSLGLTAAGQFLGTPDYTAPEQIEGLTVDGRTDQYALACAVFELLTGQAPFHRSESFAAIWAHLNKPPPSLAERRPELPPAVDPVMAKALAKAQADRYETCWEFADALRDALGLPPYHLSSASDPGLMRPGSIPGQEAAGHPSGPGAPRGAALSPLPLVPPPPGRAPSPGPAPSPAPAPSPGPAPSPAPAPSAGPAPSPAPSPAAGQMPPGGAADLAGPPPGEDTEASEIYAARSAGLNPAPGPHASGRQDSTPDDQATDPGLQAIPRAPASRPENEPHTPRHAASPPAGEAGKAAAPAKPLGPTPGGQPAAPPAGQPAAEPTDQAAAEPDREAAGIVAPRAAPAPEAGAAPEAAPARQDAPASQAGPAPEVASDPEAASGRQGARTAEPQPAHAPASDLPASAQAAGAPPWAPARTPGRDPARTPAPESAGVSARRAGAPAEERIDSPAGRPSRALREQPRVSPRQPAPPQSWPGLLRRQPNGPRTRPTARPKPPGGSPTVPGGPGRQTGEGRRGRPLRRRRTAYLALIGVVILAATGVAVALSMVMSSHLVPPGGRRLAAPSAYTAFGPPSAGDLSSVAFSPDGRTLSAGATGGNKSGSAANGVTYLWNVASGSQIGKFSPGGGAEAFSPDGTMLATAGGPGNTSTYLWRVNSQREIATLSDRRVSIEAVAFSARGRRLAVNGADGTVHVWTLPVGRRTVPAAVSPGTVASNAVVFSPKGQTLAMGGSDGQVYLWDAVTDATRTVPIPGATPITAVAFSPDGGSLAASESDGVTYIWNLATHGSIALRDLDSAGINSVAFSHDGKWLATGDGNGKTYLWQLSTGKLTEALANPKGARSADSGTEVLSVAFDPDRPTIATTDSNGHAYLWKVP